MTRERPRLVKAISSALFALCAACFLSHGFLSEYYTRGARPRSPDPGHGFIYPLEVRGGTVFITSHESILMVELWTGFEVSALFFITLNTVVLAVLYFGRSSREPPWGR